MSSSDNLTSISTTPTTTLASSVETTQYTAVTGKQCEHYNIFTHNSGNECNYYNVLQRFLIITVIVTEDASIRVHKFFVTVYYKYFW